MGRSASPSLEDLWRTVPAVESRFDPARSASLPTSAHRYLQHAIADGAPLALAVRLRMHGEIKLGRWLPFTAEQVIRTNRGMVWRASVRWNQLPILGADSLLGRQGRDAMAAARDPAGHDRKRSGHRAFGGGAARCRVHLAPVRAMCG